MLLESPDEAKSAASRPGLIVTDYRSDEERASLQPLDASRFTLSPWAKWIAADEDGEVYECADRPVRYQYGVIWVCETGDYRHIGKIDTTGIDWRQTLTPVNQAPVNADLINAQLDAWSEDHARRSLAWQLAQLDASALANVAAQLAQADSSKALLLCDALDDALLGPAQPADAVVVAHTSYDAQADMITVHNGSKRIVAERYDEYMLQAAAMQ